METVKLWFGKLGFGESCHREILQIRTVQITLKSVRTSFKRATVGGGGAAEASRAVIGERVVTAQVSDRERRSISLNVQIPVENINEVEKTQMQRYAINKNKNFVFNINYYYYWVFITRHNVNQ